MEDYAAGKPDATASVFEVDEVERILNGKDARSTLPVDADRHVARALAGFEGNRYVVTLGENVVVMDTAVLRGVRDNPLEIGSDVLIGPRAHLSGCRIEDEVFLATGTTVFNGALIGARAEVRVNAIVHLRTRLEPGTTVPLGWIAVGDPAHILPPDRHEEIWAIQKSLDFPGYVFGVERPPAGETIMPRVMPRYAAALGRRHAVDTEQ